MGLHDCTDEKGKFEISSIPEGTYVLVSNQDGKPTDREPFGTIFYPGVSARERAATISVRPGETIYDINLLVPKLEETVTIEGVLHYSDGKPAAEHWVKFKASTENKNVDGDVSEQTDTSGHFSLKVLKGLTGELSGEEWLLHGLYKNCPKVDALIAKSGRNNLTVQTNLLNLTTDHDFFNVDLSLPFPLCERAKE